MSIEKEPSQSLHPVGVVCEKVATYVKYIKMINKSPKSAPIRAIRANPRSIFSSLNNKNQRIVLRRSFRLGACCLTILIYTFKCFKGATNPRHTYVFGFKGDSLWGKGISLQEIGI